MENVPADVLSQFNQHIETEAGQPAGRHSMVDDSVAYPVHEWLSVVVKHVSFYECIAAAVEGLSRALPLTSFGCTRCGALNIDLGWCTQKLCTCHICARCGHQ